MENKIAKSIQSAKQANKKFVDLRSLFETHEIEKQSKYEKHIEDCQTVKLNKTKLMDLQSIANLTTNIPYKGKVIKVELQKIDEAFNSYEIITSSGKKYEINKNNQYHYRGIVEGENQSLVALSFYDGGVSGLLSSKNFGTININKLKNDSILIIYTDLDISNGLNSQDDCFTNSAKQNPLLNEIYSNLVVSNTLKSASSVSEDGNHLNVYIEVDNDIYEDFGSSITNVENYITGLFNQVATLYANEDIFIQISEIFIWDTPDTYSANLSDGLDDFAETRNVFNGDLALLLSYQNRDSNPNNTANAGGIAHGIGGLCVVGDDEISPHAHIALFPEFEVFPTFSRQVKVVTHEMGHVLGSRHTHACVWNGNNTAIDGCGDCLESQNEPITCNACARPAIPTEGGTIMSYCDRESVGIDFTNGFGNQPGDVIRSFIENADCLDCDITISDRNINIDVVINACNVMIENVTIEDDANVEINSSGNIVIDNTFKTEVGTTLKCKSE